MQTDDSTRFSHHSSMLSGVRRVMGVMGMALAILAVGGLAPAPDGAPSRMSGLNVSGLEGLPVADRVGRAIGEVIEVEADYRGRTRYVSVRLNDGDEVRVAAFNMWLSEQGVHSELDRDLIQRRASAY